jgi:AcrR family transcriptional regulator
VSLPETPPPPADDGARPDRRALVRTQNRRAIAAAAAELIRAKGADQLRVDEIAEQAGVSRRTVFNHFSSIEEAAYAQLHDDFDSLIEGFRLEVDGRQEDMASEVTQAFGDFILEAEPLRIVQGILETASQLSQHQSLDTWGWQAVEHTIGSFAELVSAAYPEADPVRVRILCTVLVESVAIALEGCAERPQSLEDSRARVLDALAFLSSSHFSFQHSSNRN